MEDIKIFESAQFGQIRTFQGTSGKPLLSLKNVCITNGLQAKKSMKKLPDEMIVRVPVQRGLKKKQLCIRGIHRQLSYRRPYVTENGESDMLLKCTTRNPNSIYGFNRNRFQE